MRQKWIAIAATILLMLASYVLVYAPYLAFRYSDEPVLYTELHHRGFEPVEWLIDHSPLQQPLFLWARLWGCEARMEMAHFERELERAVIVQ